MNIASDESTHGLGDASLPPHIAELRALLSGEIRDVDTPEADRLVAIAATDFLSQAEDHWAMWDALLLALAAMRGIAAAKKKHLKLARWEAAPPPPLFGEGLTEDEQVALLRSLQAVGGSWAFQYGLQFWNKARSDKVRNELTAWVLKRCGTIANLLAQSAALDSNHTSQYLTALFVGAAKSAALLEGPHTAQVLSRAQEVVEHVLVDASADAERLKDALFGLVTEVVAAAHFVVISPEAAEFVAVFSSPLGQRPKLLARWKKVLAQAARTVEASIARTEETLSVARSIDRVLKALPDGWMKEPSAGDAYTNEQAVLFGVASAMDALRDSDPAMSAEPLIHLSHVAQVLQLEPLEDSGKVTSFRAGWHQPVDGDLRPGVTVTVLKPGWLRRRTDGSAVILFKALVKQETQG